MTVRANKPAFNIREKLKELTQSIGLKGRELMRAATAQEARDLVSAGRRNLAMNGAMSVWQRGTAQTTITSGSQYLADRWSVATGGSAQVTHEQSTDSPPGFVYSLKVSPSVADTLSSTEQMHITHLIEAQNLTFLNWGTTESIPITISFWAKSNDTSNKCLWIYAQDAGDHIARQFHCKKANTWEKFTFTIPGNPLGVINNDSGVGIYVRVVLDAGNTSADGSLPETWTNLTNNSRYGDMGRVFATSTSNEFYLTGVQVEAGKNATEFEHRTYGEELQLCQRYFEVTFSGDGGYSNTFMIGKANTTSQAVFAFPWKVEKRAVPTTTVTGSWALYYNGVTSTSSGSFGNLDNGVSGGRFTINSISGSPLTVGEAVHIDVQGTFRFTADAEL